MKSINVEAETWWNSGAWLETGSGLVQLALLALIAAFLIWRLLRVLGRRPATKPCRWRSDKRRHGASLDRWVCTVCGVDAYSADGKRPKECKRLLREVGL